MRKIKFRGKRFDNNHDDWIYGHLHVIDTCGGGYTGKAIQQQCGTSRPYSVQVYSETVGQFTGLKDKNGKEIYEGDVLNGCEVYWSKQWAMFALRGGSVGALIKFADDYEVIGNIYENLELLER